MGGDASRNGAELFETEADFSAKIVTFKLVNPPVAKAPSIEVQRLVQSAFFMANFFEKHFVSQNRRGWR